jgi:putative salt-induced outer membrane protein
VRAARWLLLFLLAMPGVARAQAAPPPPPPKHEGSADFAFVGATGNADTQTIGLGGELVNRPEKWETKLKTRYLRNKSEDALTAQSFIFTGRAQRGIKKAVAGYGAYGYERDTFAGILDRNVIEGGLAFKLIDQKRHSLTADAGLGYTNEQRLVGDHLSTATFGTGAEYKLKISDTSLITEDAHLNLSLSNSDDWRYANAIALSAKVTTVFSLKLSNTIRYVNAPVTGFQTTDATTAVALVAKF